MNRSEPLPNGVKIHQLDVAEALQSLQTRAEGLTAQEARRRLAEFGPNLVERVRRKSPVVEFLRGFVHFFAVILWIAAGLAFVAEAWDPGQGMATLGFAIVGVIVVNNAFSFWQQFRAEQAIRALQKLLPQTTRVFRDGRVVHAAVAELVPGDVILLGGGDNVPADCRVLEATAVRANRAVITGESMPHACEARPSAEAEALHARNVLLAGTALFSGNARAVVFATGGRTAFGRIAHWTQQAKETETPLLREIGYVSRVVASLALVLGVLFFFIGQMIGLTFWQNFLFAIGIIVANVPEGLLPTVTLALAMGAQRMARRRALVRHLPAVETLGAATVICTDKTGTLTGNRMTARSLCLDGRCLEVEDGAGLAALARGHPRFFAVARHCHNVAGPADAAGRPRVGDPLEIALLELAARAKCAEPLWPRLAEIPFDSQRRRLATIHRGPDGPILFLKGAPEVVLERCRRVQGAGGPEPLTDAGKAGFEAAQREMAARGLRLLALAWRTLPEAYDLDRAEEDLILVGLIGLDDPPRPEVPAAIAKCRAAGIRVIMVTGDHPETARAVAREIGLARSDAAVVVTGERLRLLSDVQLQLALDAPEIVFARVEAEQKMRIVVALKNKKEIVAVTGDGVNDAPALKQGHIGIAMGLGGTDVAREASDMILLDDNFATIVDAIEEGRAVYANIRKFLTYILTSNIPELVPYLAFVLFRIPLPLTIIQILAVDLGTDMVPALALGAEPPGAHVMQELPRPIAERLLNGPLLARAYLWLGPMQAAAALGAFFFVLDRGGWTWGRELGPRDPLYLQATTACLSAIVVTQVANLFLCRSRRESAFRFGLFDNPLILVGIATELAIILLIDYTPWGNALFGTAPIPLAVWGFAAPFALGMLVLEEARKALVRGRATPESGV